MVTATTTKTTPTSEIPEFAEKIREQLLSAVKHGQQLSIDAAQAWAKALSVLPTPDLPKVPGAPVLPKVQALNKFGFDVASDLLSAQRDYTLRLASVLVPEPSV